MRNGILEVGDKVKCTLFAPKDAKGQYGRVISRAREHGIEIAGIKTDNGKIFIALAAGSDWVVFITPESINIEEII